MVQRNYFLSLIALIFSLACNKKEVIVKPLSDKNFSQAESSKVDTSKGWYGLYRFWYDDPDNTTYHTLSDKYIIANGEARVSYNEDINLTIINYDIPLNQIIHGDSTTFKLAVKNSSTQLVFNLIGIKNKASFNYYAYNDTGFYTIGLGSIVKQIKVFPATDFSNFKLVQFVLDKNKAFVYVGNNLITSFNYGTQNKMGAVKQISLGKTGFIECNYVRLYNSFTQKLIMREEFNVDGKSHTVFNP